MPAHALCYLDLDRFKVVNDTCGHTAGDNMLREVASIIKDAVRDSDTVGRIGGDEFALLLVGCPLEKARQIADDVVHSVGDYRFVWKDKIFNIGVSVGSRRDRARRRRHRGSHEFGRLGLLCRQETGRSARARVLARARRRARVIAARSIGCRSCRARCATTSSSCTHNRSCTRRRRFARTGARGVRAHGRRERPASRAACGIHPRRGTLPLDAAMLIDGWCRRYCRRSVAAA